MEIADSRTFNNTRIFSDGKITDKNAVKNKITNTNNHKDTNIDTNTHANNDTNTDINTHANNDTNTGTITDTDIN